MRPTTLRRRAPQPDWYIQWAESLPDGVRFCLCPGVTWVNRDPRTSRPCRLCGNLRNDDMCVVVTDDERHHKRRGCRSVDEAHIAHAVRMLSAGQLLSRFDREALGISDA